MQVVCITCGRRLEWSHKQDRRLAELRCPHCGGAYRKTGDYTDWADPAMVRRAAKDAAARIHLSVRRLETAVKELERVPDVLAEARKALARLEDMRARDTVSDALTAMQGGRAS